MAVHNTIMIYKLRIISAKNPREEIVELGVYKRPVWVVDAKTLDDAITKIDGVVSGKVKQHKDEKLRTLTYDYELIEIVL